MSKIVIAERTYKWVERCEELQKENTRHKTDCKTLAQKLLQAKPELRGWLETNYGEYL